MKLLVIFLLLFGTIHSLLPQPQVKVEQGDLIGTTYSLKNGRTFFAFLGIPYAVPITHKNRFKEPQPLGPWAGIWNATTLSSACLQYSHPAYSIVGEEDCLYLNVYTPKLPESGVSPLLDVLVYIHGGAFMFGSGNDIRPDYILKNNDVVVVTINYRLGILGFFSSGDSIVPGNNGLKDQVTALRWIHHNIIQFGGNPASVTISGCSAGGASVHYQMLSPMSDGLFQKAVSMSGTTLPPWTLPRSNTEKSIELATYVGCATNTTRDMVKCLRKRPARQLVEMQKNFMTWRYTPFSPFGPTVEPLGSMNNFLTEEPLQLLKSGRVKNLPWLTTLAAHEGLYPASDFIPHETLLKELNDNWNDIAPHLLMYNFSVSTDNEKSKVSAAIREFYLGAKSISNDTISEIIQMLGDRLFYNDIIRAIKLHVSNTKTTDAYCYKFSYRGKYSLTTKYAHNEVDYGASHSDDVYYILKCFSYDFDETVSDAAMIDMISSIISSFMRTGKPNITSNVLWEPISSNLNENLRCLEITSPHQTPTMMEYNNQQTIEFWRNLLPSEYPTEDVIASVPKNEL